MIKKIIKIYQKILYYSGFTEFLKIINKNKTRILMYHSIEGPNFLPKNLVVSKKKFEKQLIYLKKNYNIISYKQFIAGKTGVLLTFDDGFMDNYRNAYPILKKHNVPAMFFLLGKTDTINWLHKLYYLYKKKGTDIINNFNALTNNNFKALYECVDYLKYKTTYQNKIITKLGDVDINNLYLTQKEIKNMSNLIEFGYHTKNHTVAKLTPEIELKSNCNSFAYPFGEEKSYNKNTIKILKKYYKCAFCTTEGFYSKNKFKIERISITNINIPEFASIVEGSNFFINNLYKKLRFQR